MTTRPCSQVLFRLLACSFVFLVMTVAMAAGSIADTRCPVVHIEAERLPDLNVPRGCHSLFVAGGEVVVAGGHTDGFVPTQTAEYFADGEWHLIPMVYIADCALCQVLSSGRVLLAGGLAENLGIGQMWTMQTYDPATHTFSGYGCLDKKRAMLSGVELDSGRVVISGNWYRHDFIGLYDGHSQVDSIKPVAQERSLPYILRTAKDNAIIFSFHNNRSGHYSDTIWVDRFRGEPFREPLLEGRKFLATSNADHCAADFFIGDEEAGEYTYLLPVQDKDSAVSILRIHGEHFEPFPTAVPVPTEYKGKTISYFDSFVVDRRVPCAYLLGMDSDLRLYLLRVDYASDVRGRGAPLMLYYTDPLPAPVYSIPVLTPDGDLVVAGGNMREDGIHLDNYIANSAAYRLHVGTLDTAGKTGTTAWWWLVAMLVALIGAYGIYKKYWRGGKKEEESKEKEESKETEECKEKEESIEKEESNEKEEGKEKEDGAENEESNERTHSALMTRICEVMESQQLFLQSDLKLSDLAVQLGESRNAISNCIRIEEGCTFPNFVNAYRVNYAKQLMLDNPEAKISSLYPKAGFANETSFFRTFKEFTGQTPSEWRDANM